MKEWINKHKVGATLIAVGAGLLIIAIIVVSIISSIFNTRNEGERYEQRLTAVYNQSVISLGTCLDQGQIAAQVTQQEFESLKDLLESVVAARYTDESSAAAAIGSGKLFSLVVENYPSIDQRSWQNLQTVVVGCRDEFQGTQDRIQTEAALYNEWRVTDDPFNAWIKAEFPSDELKVTVGGQTLYGQAAYDQITTVVTLTEALDAFETGVMPGQQLFGED